MVQPAAHSLIALFLMPSDEDKTGVKKMPSDFDRHKVSEQQMNKAIAAVNKHTEKQKTRHYPFILNASNPDSQLLPP